MLGAVMVARRMCIRPGWVAAGIAPKFAFLSCQPRYICFLKRHMVSFEHSWCCLCRPGCLLSPWLPLSPGLAFLPNHTDMFGWTAAPRPILPWLPFPRKPTDLKTLKKLRRPFVPWLPFHPLHGLMHKLKIGCHCPPVAWPAFPPKPTDLNTVKKLGYYCPFVPWLPFHPTSTYV